jgi:hypothetical protein
VAIHTSGYALKRDNLTPKVQTEGQSTPLNSQLKVGRSR